MTTFKMYWIAALLFSSIFLACGLLAVKDISTPISELHSDSATIQSINISQIRVRKKYRKTLNIQLFNKPYSIKISASGKSYWPALQQDSTSNKQIHYRYFDHQLDENLLKDPSEIMIGNVVIIPLSHNIAVAKTKRNLFFLASAIFGVGFFFLFKKYRKTQIISA